MENNLLFIIGLGISLFLLATWGFRFLPREKWQVLGTVPLYKKTDGKWQGLNLTYYGLFNGVAIAAAVAIMMILLGSASIPMTGAILFICGTGLFAAPATKIVARIVEKKPCTLSVAGASFVGIVVAPLIAFGVQQLYVALQMPRIEIIVLMAAVSCAYTFGEGIGRLSCISFGCCYGKQVSELPGYLQAPFRHLNFVFKGKTKKIAYAHHMDEKAVVPIQGITSVIYFISGLLGVYLFLTGHFTLCFLTTLATTQIWRVVSETVRADFRGNGKLSIYQIMAFVSVVYSVIVSLLLYPDPGMPVNIANGINTLWNPLVILFLQALWFAAFFGTGRSKIIDAELSFEIKTENI